MTCPYHGFYQPCPTCRKANQASDRAAAKAGTWAYCVFLWRGDGKYRIEDSIDGKRYQLKKPAQTYADQLNYNGPARLSGGYVVRFVPIPKPKGEVA